ncbi:site-specific integrase [Weissella minor]|uniref:tyrosine-type recombinase/integrase n=1 Tax=Weissella minor TaxID=1620 RepID=UPI001BB0A338|nr:tyrosine-type recombinase/integrase [Weissella minor]MBS0950452.1 site-specific integrase [Weissella minor]
MPRKRGKTWQARIIYTTPSGERKQEDKSGFKTKAAASAYEAKRRTEIYEGKTTNDHILFTEYYDDWLKIHLNQNLKTQTICNHTSTQRIVHEYFKNFYLNEITRKDMQKFVNDFASTHKASTTKQTFIRIAMPLKEAFNDGLLKKNPTSDIKIPKDSEVPQGINYLENSDMTNLLDYIEETEITAQTFAIYIALLSGMRLGEILALTYDDIDTDNKTISITRNKTNQYPFEYTTPKTISSIRIISMPENFFKQLKRYQETHPNADQHFLGDNHEQHYYTRVLKLILKEINAKPITFHGLRHTHASYLINNGVDVAYVSERIGHSNIAITQKTYFHLLDNKRKSEQQKAMELF